MIYKTFYNNGIIKTEKTYINNKLEGSYTEYHYNSRVKIQGQYIKDKKTCKWTYYDINNKKLKVETYDDGNLIKTKNY